MELDQLQAFLAVVHEGSFTAAAESLSLTQPSLSARIHNLEQIVGGMLFQRERRPVRLTLLGETFLPYVERALNILEAGQEALQLVRQGAVGRVIVGATFSLSTYLLPQVVMDFNWRYPLADLYIEAGHTDFVMNQLKDGVFNLGLAAAFPNLLAQTRVLLRLHDKMIVAVSPEHPLANQQNVALGELWQYRLVLINWGKAFDTHIESLRQMVTDPGPMLRVPLAAALPMARQPDTITFMPQRLAAVFGLAEVHTPELVYGWDSALMTRPGRTLTVLEQAFVEIVDNVWHGSPQTKR
ncbi:MAG: LysR family transcriptional regulator [Chloroflexi bacterium]|nr:LysR family transcriptional regulator [Chloroflexota bacterium]MBP8055546.1 LysR family transcriptional regulator [Chloroflexota bacterium]